MRHDWIFDVLLDLKAYAQTNGLEALALKTEEVLRVARAEIVISSPVETGRDADDHEAPPTTGRPH